MFVGTKKQAADAVAEEATVQVNTSSTTVGWGTLTNWGTIQKRIARLKEIKRWKKMELSKFFLRKKLHFLTNNVHVLKKFLGGIEDMPRIPDVMYVVDPHKDKSLLKKLRNWDPSCSDG